MPTSVPNTNAGKSEYYTVTMIQGNSWPSPDLISEAALLWSYLFSSPPPRRKAWVRDKEQAELVDQREKKKLLSILI